MPRYDNSTSAQSASTTTLSFSHVCSGNALIVYTVCHTLTAVSNITYGGVTLENPGDQITTGTYSMEIWDIGYPLTGSNTVAVTFGGPVVDALVIAISYFISSINVATSPYRVNRDNGQEGGSVGSSTSPATFSTTPTFFNDLFSIAIASAATGTAITCNNGGVNRIDVVQGTVRMAVFDFLYPTKVAFTPGGVTGNNSWLIEQYPLVNAPNNLSLLGVS